MAEGYGEYQKELIEVNSLKYESQRRNIIFKDIN